MAIAFKGFGFNTSSTASSTATISNATTAIGDCVVVMVGIENTAVSVSSVTDAGGNTYMFLGAKTNSTGRVELWGFVSAKASTGTITVHFTGGTTAYEVAAWIGTGVLGFGVTVQNSGTSTTPSVSLTTQDSNNWIMAGAVHVGTGAFTIATGNLRKDTSAGSANDGVIGDNTVASPGSVTNSYTITSSAWAIAAVELRTVAPTVAPVFPQAVPRYDPPSRIPGPPVVRSQAGVATSRVLVPTPLPLALPPVALPLPPVRAFQGVAPVVAAIAPTPLRPVLYRVPELIPPPAVQTSAAGQAAAVVPLEVFPVPRWRAPDLIPLPATQTSQAGQAASVVPLVPLPRPLARPVELIPPPAAVVFQGLVLLPPRVVAPPVGLAPPWLIPLPAVPIFAGLPPAPPFAAPPALVYVPVWGISPGGILVFQGLAPVPLPPRTVWPQPVWDAPALARQLVYVLFVGTPPPPPPIISRGPPGISAFGYKPWQW